MRIAFVVHRVHPPYFGGDEIQTIETAKELIRNGVDVSIFSADLVKGLEKRMYYAGVEINRFQSIGPYYLSPGLYKAICNVETDILHSFTFGHFPTLAAAICKAKNKQVKYVLQPHFHGRGRNLLSNLIMKIYNPMIGKWVFSKADRVRCLSGAEKDLVIKHFHVAPSKISVIPFGLDVEKLGMFKNRFQKKDQVHRILYVGQLEKFKGVHMLVEAFARLEKTLPGEVALRIVGDGSQKPDLMKLVRRLRIQDSTTFLSRLPEEDLYREYCEADLFVLLSNLESYSIVVREALFFELPVIVSRNEVFEDLIKQGYCFAVTPPVNADLLAQVMKEFVQKRLTLKKFKPMALRETAKELIKWYNEIM